MGLTKSSVGIKAVDLELVIGKTSPEDKVIALAGNPNVGKSTVFNGLTGMNQHTGNWPGKTVTNAQGLCQTQAHSYIMVDLPGTYSLMAHSKEEEVARNFICFGQPDAVMVVCDGTCLERNLNLALQTMEISRNVVLCVNLMDEAKRKDIHIDLAGLEEILGIPVIGIVAQKKSSLSALKAVMDSAINSATDWAVNKAPYQVTYAPAIEEAISIVQDALFTIQKAHLIAQEAMEPLPSFRINPRWLSLRLLDWDSSLAEEIKTHLGTDFLESEPLTAALAKAREILAQAGITGDSLKDMIVTSLVSSAETICSKTVTYGKKTYDSLDRRVDKIITSKTTGYPIMLALLALIFWITITGANYPSALLSDGLFWVQDRLTEFFHYINAPDWLHGMLVLGLYRVLAWVVSVMLPPMAIFFPLFTLLEDAGYLPRVAYNLDKPFKRCCACGKQALTMCMGFGCNAAGITGCRIIDSPRERLLAILTNNFVPCNGRFPTLIAILTMFFVGTGAGTGTGKASNSLLGSLLSAVLLTLVILLGVFMTLAVTKALSKTLLKGVPSSFTLELPPYRKPQIGKVIVRSMLDRTLFVLGRAIVVAAPAGVIIWVMANVTVGDASLLSHCAGFLDPFASLMGLDGVILLAFVLGLPANEIVVPIIIMAYTAQSSILEMDSMLEMHELFVANGWTWVTALCTMLFSLMHWPCSTALITIKKETGSWKWTGLGALIPTVCGVVVCTFVATAARLFC